MRKTKDSPRLTRLSKDELRRSRAGTLGRFPAPDLYEPETEDEGKPTAAKKRTSPERPSKQTAGANS